MMKTAIRYTLLMLIWLAAERVDGQYYSKRVPLLGHANGYISGIQISDDTIYTICPIIDTLPPYKSVVLFVKFDKYGNILAQNIFDIPIRSYIGADFSAFIRTNDGGFAYGGYTIGTNQNENALLLLKYDRHGDFMWYQEIPDTTTNWMYCQKMIQDSFSNFYMTGTLEHALTSDQDMYLTKIDGSGNLIYYKVFNNPSFTDGAEGLAINSKGNLLLGGGSGIYDISDFSRTIGYSKVYELDTNGNQIRFVLGTDSNGPAADNMILNADGSFLTASIYGCYKDISTLKNKGCIAKFDSNFHEIWRIEAGPCSIWTDISDHKKLPDGNYIAVGTFYDDTDTTNNHLSGWVLKYSGDGNIIWSKIYRGTTGIGFNGDYNSFSDVDFLSDGSLICAGESTNYDSPLNGQQAWLLHLDTAGCLPDSNSCGIVDAIIEPASSGASVRVYPNPAADVMTISCRTDEPSVRTISIGNMLGQVMAERVLGMDQAAVTQDVRLWPAGVYSYRVVSEKGFVGSGSFVVNH